MQATNFDIPGSRQLAFQNKKTALIIQGPTAVGKTSIAIAVAQRLGTEIISADSRQCYQGMSIGTAQPSPEELKAVKHHFVNEYPVTENITAAAYETIALGCLEQIFKAHDVAVVCGGTGLYIQAICNGLDEMPQVSGAVATEVNETYEMKGLEWLQKALQDEDPEFYAGAEQQNPARLLRALAFKRATGDSILKYRSGSKKKRDFHIIKVGLELPREVLYGRINKRVDAMMDEGLLEEVKKLLPYQDLKNLQTVGYAELFDHLNGELGLDEAIDKIKQHTRNYAKRQMTWFKKDKEVRWLSADDRNVVANIIKLIT